MNKSTHLDVKGQTLALSKPKSGFTQINNQFLLDERLSFKARGILALLLSRPKDWKIYLDEIASRSEKDGKRAIQSGFKELTDLGYLKLRRVYDHELKRFGGTCYQLNPSSLLSRQSCLETVCFSDSLESRPSEIQIATKPDSHKTALHSNKENSNTKNRNTKNQQQQLGDDDGEKINFFFEKLLTDLEWRDSFDKNSISKFEENFSFLLFHFRQTSLQSGENYHDFAAAKKHFRNWFQVNWKKDNLPAFIQIQRTNHRNIRKSILEKIQFSDKLLETLQQRKCKSPSQVLEYQKLLKDHLSFYDKNKFIFQNKADHKALGNLLSDLQKQIGQIERGRTANKLNWYCQ